jgi:membrane protease YdiL (CAAX protease family)
MIQTDAHPAGPPPGQPWGPGATVLLTLAVFLLYTLVQALGMTLVAVVGPVDPPEAAQGLQLALGTLIAVPFGVALVAALLQRRGLPLREALGLVPASRRAVLASSLVLGLVLVSYDLVSRLLGRPAVPDFMLDIYRTAVWPPILFLAIAGAAPLFEEVLFRGFLLPGLARSPLGGAGAVLLSALLFALPHLQYDLFDVSAVFVLGVVFGAVRLHTGSLWLPIALHAATNLLATAQVALYLS